MRVFEEGKRNARTAIVFCIRVKRVFLLSSNREDRCERRIRAVAIAVVREVN